MIKINLGKSESSIVNDFYERIISHINNPKTLIEKEITNERICKKFLNDLKKSVVGDLLDNTQNIIIAKPNDLIKYIEYFQLNYFELFNDLNNLKKYKDKKNKINETKPVNKSDLKEISDKISEIVYFSNFLKNTFYYKYYDKWDAYKLASDLYDKANIKVCPYCNRNFVTVLVDEENGGKTRMTYDHFYDKATFPYLALSFYNLVPSCKVCNSDFKNTKNFYNEPHIHPYIDDINKLKFKLDIENVDFINAKIGSYNIKLNVDDFKDDCYNRTKIINHNNTFKIEQLSNFHKSISDKIIRKFYIYNEDKINELYNSFDGQLFSSKEEIFLMIYGMLSVNNDEPFSKLTLDIIDDLNGKKYFFDGIVAENE